MVTPGGLAQVRISKSGSESAPRCWKCLYSTHPPLLPSPLLPPCLPLRLPSPPSPPRYPLMSPSRAPQSQTMMTKAPPQLRRQVFPSHPPSIQPTNFPQIFQRHLLYLPRLVPRLVLLFPLVHPPRNLFFITS